MATSRAEVRRCNEDASLHREGGSPRPRAGAEQRLFASLFIQPRRTGEDGRTKKRNSHGEEVPATVSGDPNPLGVARSQGARGRPRPTQATLRTGQTLIPQRGHGGQPAPPRPCTANTSQDRAQHPQITPSRGRRDSPEPGGPQRQGDPQTWGKMMRPQGGGGVAKAGASSQA